MIGLGPKWAPALEDEILIACSRLHLDVVHRDRVISACARGEIDWGLVYSSAVAHKIAPLVYKNLESCGSVKDLVPGKVLDDFRDVSAWFAFKNAVAEKRIAEMAAFFESRSHDVLLLKHAALSVRLREVYAVMMADDVDAVVRPRCEPPAELDERYLVTNFRPWTVASRYQKVLRRFIRDCPDPTNGVIDEF